MTFLEKHKLPKMTQEETENLNSSILIFKMEFVMQTFP